MIRSHCLLVLVSLLLAACWQRQDIDILLPEWPHYTISGYTVDLDDTAEALPYTPIELTAVKLFYDVTFEPVTILSDSSGYFQIDSVTPGNYFLTAQRDGYTVLNVPLSVEHADRPYSPKLPKPLLNHAEYNTLGGSNPGLAWSGGTLYMPGYYSFNPDYGEYSIFKCMFNAGRLSFVTRRINPDPDATTFADANEVLYLVNRLNVMTVSVVDMSLITTFELDSFISGLAWADPAFWTTQGNRLQNRGKDLKTVAASYETGAEVLGPLAHDGDHFWSYDAYRGLILKLDDEGNILASYRPINVDNKSWIEVHDMDFQMPRMLWATDKQRQHLYLFYTL